MATSFGQKGIVSKFFLLVFGWCGTPSVSYRLQRHLTNSQTVLPLFPKNKRNLLVSFNGAGVVLGLPMLIYSRQKGNPSLKAKRQSSPARQQAVSSPLGKGTAEMHNKNYYSIKAIKSSQQISRTKVTSKDLRHRKQHSKQPFKHRKKDEICLSVCAIRCCYCVKRVVSSPMFERTVVCGKFCGTEGCCSATPEQSAKRLLRPCAGRFCSFWAQKGDKRI